MHQSIDAILRLYTNGLVAAADSLASGSAIDVCKRQVWLNRIAEKPSYLDM
nr:hypothetical protein [uncultured Undibacterium sp.]